MTRLTWLNTVTYVVGWSPDSRYILFRSTHQAVHHRGSDAWLFRVPVDGGPVQGLPLGPAVIIDHQPEGPGVLLGRNSLNNSRWKRYRGGMVGEIWVDSLGKGDFRRILTGLKGNPVCPKWIGNRVWFVSDHEDLGNFYSCSVEGQDLRQESFQKDYYVRQPAADGNRLVYHCGGELWSLDPGNRSNRERRIPIQWRSTRSRIQRRFFYGDHYLEDAVLHPGGHEIAMLARGKLFSMPHWEQVVRQYGSRHGVRYRIPCWLTDGRIAIVSDSNQSLNSEGNRTKGRKRKTAPGGGSEERLEIFAAEPLVKPENSFSLPQGRVQEMVSSPRYPHLVVTTSRMELHLINLITGRTRKLDSSGIREISDPVFSPDGGWLAYTK